MNRYTAWIAALTGAALFFSHPVDTHAATRKKKPPVDASDDDTATPAPKKNATPPLNLPLPSKDAVPGKKTADDATPAPASAKDGDKTKPEAKTESKAKGEHAPNATVEPDQITEFATQPPRIQQMIRDAIDLTRLNLTYTFGSSDPDSGGMDCSGTIYYLLHAHKFEDAPRDSSGQYLWTRRGGFFPVVSKSTDSVEFKDLLPGDLMFWTGTYESGRDVPISHVMMYLGREKGSGKRIMFGASDGRSYNGVQRWGVSVFDFKMPKADSANPEKTKPEFIGFARIPGLRGPAPAPGPVEQDTAGGEKPAAAAAATPTPTPSKAGSTKSSRKKKKASAD